MHLPYPTGDQEPALSKLDNASTPEERMQCMKYPYRRIVGQLMYGMVHTMVGILYALNVLSRYGNNPGPRHIKFLRRLLHYCKYARSDRLVFHGHDGPRDIETMTTLFQLFAMQIWVVIPIIATPRLHTLDTSAATLSASVPPTKAAYQHQRQSRKSRLSTTHSKQRS